jgi:hypothetical protein
MSEQPLTFASHEGHSDLEKQVPVQSVEHVESPVELPTTMDMSDLVMSKRQVQADLYHGKLFSVVPKEFDVQKQDITPDVQDFHPRKVLLWDNYDSLFKFDESVWQKIVVLVPRDALGHRLFKETGDVYTIDIIPVGWAQPQPNPPQYVE